MVKLTTMMSSAALAAVAMISQHANVRAAAAINLGDCVDFAFMGGKVYLVVIIHTLTSLLLFWGSFQVPLSTSTV